MKNNYVCYRDYTLRGVYRDYTLIGIILLGEYKVLIFIFVTYIILY